MAKIPRPLLLGVPLLLLASVVIGAAIGARWASRQRMDPSLLTVLHDVEKARMVAPADAPDVVLVIACTLRRDQVGPYGGPEGLTPFLDELAVRGAVLEDPIAAAPWTKPAATALLTGRHALALGMVEASEARNEHAVPAEVQTLAERFRGAGYSTIGATTNPNLNAVFGFDQGFDHYMQPSRLWTEGMLKLPGRDVVPEVLALTRDRRDPQRPLYLQVLLIDTHSPRDDSPERIAPFLTGGVDVELAAYRAAVRELDANIEALHDGLPAGRPTIFVVVSDHGEGLQHPPHHGRSHGRYLTSSAIHGVWMAKGPMIPAGHRVAGVASQLDNLPTLLGLAGLGGYVGEGLDLSEAIEGGGVHTGREVAFADTWFMWADRAAAYSDSEMCQRRYDIRAEDALGGGRFQPGCFDRQRDSLQSRPSLEPNPLLERLDHWRTAREQDAQAWDAPAVPVSDDLGKQLEALGYADP